VSRAPMGSRTTSAARPAPRAAAPLRADPVRSRTPNTNASAATSRELQELRQQVSQSDETIRGLEKERDFYFNKLRDIEILVQQFAAEIEEKSRISGEPIAEECDVLVKEIQAILYSTEVWSWMIGTDWQEGFEVPPEEGQEVLDDNETF